jgi:UDP-3-O-[3-hydroxymyristoyl] glucosamine N-acyltransferase
MKLREISAIVKSEIGEGADVEIYHLAKIEEAQPGDITFLSNPKYSKYLATTQASAVLVAIGLEYKELSLRKTPIILVRVSDPYIAFLLLIDVFYPKPNSLPLGVHPTAIIPSTSIVGEGAAIGAYVVVGENASIGKNTTIWHGTVIGDNVDVGDNTLIYANVSIREQCSVGNNVIIHSGTVVGSDGFGFAPKPDGTYEKIPQRGHVVIEDNVEIGSNCSIDRATLGETRIKRGAKIDNLIMIAHNVVIGENTVIAAQAGISGSTKLGNNCIVAGQAGVIGHLQIANKTTIAAQSGISKSITEEGKTFFGSPALEIAEMRRVIVAERQLPKLLTEIESLKKRLEELEKILKGESKK